MCKRAKVFFIVCLLALASVMFTVTAKAEENPGTGIGFGTSGLYLKLFSNSPVSIEARYSFLEQGITTFGPRLYINFNPNDPFVVSIGPELDFIAFNVSGVTGSGTMFYGFINADWHISRNLALDFDCGPTYIWLKDKSSNIGYEKSDFLYNLGIYIYF